MKFKFAFIVVYQVLTSCVSVYKTWFSRYPLWWYIVYNNESEFKLPFRSLCDTYGIKHKPTNVKNPQANVILEHIHAVLGNMLCTSELDMAKTAKPSDIDVFLSDAAWAVCSAYHTVLKASPGAANIWTRYVIWHSVHSWQAKNWIT